jgi:hypothetical protein
MRKKFPGNYPMGLRHGSRGAELEGGLDPINQLNKITDEEEQQVSDPPPLSPSTCPPPPLNLVHPSNGTIIQI